VLDGGKPIGEVTADARGEWVLVPDAPLASGNRQLYLEATGKEGGPVRRSADIVALSVASPVTAGGSPSTLAVLLPGDADKPARVLQKSASSEGQTLSLDTAEYGARNRLMLTGQADPASRLNVYAGDRLIGTVTADEAGKWSFSAPRAEPMGGVELRLDQLAADGTVARRVAAAFEAVGAGVVAAGGSYVVRRGNSLWLIARQVYGDGSRYCLPSAEGEMFYLRINAPGFESSSPSFFNTAHAPPIDPAITPPRAARRFKNSPSRPQDALSLPPCASRTPAPRSRPPLTS
jgi:hypothetical protein